KQARGVALAGLAEAARRAEVAELIQHAAVEQEVRRRAHAPAELDGVGRAEERAERRREAAADRAPRDDQPSARLGRLAAGPVLARQLAKGALQVLVDGRRRRLV